MGWYRRCSRLIFDAFRRRRCNSNTITIPRNPIYANTNSIRSRISQFSSPPLSRNLSFQNVLKNNPFLDGSKRFFSMGRNKVQHFKPMGWSQNPRTVIMLGCGALITVYFLNMEMVPYTKRPQFVLLPISREKRLSDSWFEVIKYKYKKKILPPPHPQNIRVQKIAQNIIEAQRELRKEPESVMLPHDVNKEETVMGKTRRWMIDFLNKLGKVRNWIIDSLNSLGERESQSTADLDGFKWEVIVVNEPRVSAYCMPSGKIVVFSGLLDYFKEDDEVAAIIGHEVGHAVARHYAEKFSNNWWLGILYLIIYQIGNIYIYDEELRINQAMLTYSKRMEMEADYIGLLLMASAGYDPRVASHVWEKFGNYGCNSPFKDQLPLLQGYLATHPCGKERCELLSHPKLMEEALSIYTKVKAQRRRLV